MSDPFSALVALVERLRRDCPWDREQSFESLKTFLLEECHETLEALDSGSPEALAEELGDLLFQILFLARLAEERGWFAIDDVARATASKMIERHPHVFAGATARDAGEVKRNWESRKRREKQTQTDPFGTIPATLPALSVAYRQTSRAADLGFDWERDGDVAAKIEEELEEWRQAAQQGDADAERKEIGDLLLSVVNLARRRRMDPEATLRATNSRFRSRFSGVSRRAHASGREISEVSMEELDRFWEEAKKEEFAAIDGRDGRREEEIGPK